MTPAKLETTRFARRFVAPDEAAMRLRGGLSSTDFDALRQHLRDESIRVQHQPWTITEGFLYLPRVEGGRYVDIRLGGDVYWSRGILAAIGLSNQELAEIRLRHRCQG